MKRVIKGKLYDTDTAAEVAERSEGAIGDFGRVEETLYRKRIGEYFLYCWGGPASRYAEQVSASTWSSGSVIKPLSYDEAKAWAEGAMDADGWQAEFGPAEDSGEGSPAHIHATVSEAARRALEDECRSTGESRSAVIERLLLGLRR